MRSKRPTLSQKKLIRKRHLDSKEWLVKRASPYTLEITHRYTSNTRVIPEGYKGRMAV